jgi:hypothetical protein
MPLSCRENERSGPKRVLVVDQGPRACRRQHLASGSYLGVRQEPVQVNRERFLPPVLREVEPLRF